MVLRGAWGTCNGDPRYTKRLEGCRLVRFFAPKRDLEKCTVIKACGRPHGQLDVSRVNQHKAVCSKHIVGYNGPTKEYLDPIPADGSKCTPACRRLVKRILVLDKGCSEVPTKKIHLQDITNRVSAMDMLALTA